MRAVVVVVMAVVSLAALACTRPNPNRCCTDEADCVAKSIPVGSGCDDGLVCRGNQCIAQPCASAAACDLAAPYCVGELCAEACTTDEHCPGFGQLADRAYCTGGTCATCRDDGDCRGNTPVCAAGSCQACAERSECPTGVCTASGACAADSEIAHVSTAGSPTTDCTHADPCTIARALTFPAKQYILIQAGTYTHAAATTVSGSRWLVGTGTTRPRITSSAPGPVFHISPGANVRFENLEIFGAVSAEPNGPLGIALNAQATGAGARSIELVDVELVNNDIGLGCGTCVATVRTTQFRGNGWGLYMLDGVVSVDRSVFEANVSGVYVQRGTTTITNSFFVRQELGVEICDTTAAALFESNTFADNTMYAIQSCGDYDFHATFRNNIFARNGALKNAGLTSPSFAGSIITTDITALKFKSPDAAPYDYHITSGSSAIDQAVPSTLAHDIDGQPRPLGAAADVGADELE